MKLLDTIKIACENSVNGGTTVAIVSGMQSKTAPEIKDELWGLVKKGYISLSRLDDPQDPRANYPGVTHPCGDPDIYRVIYVTLDGKGA